MNKNIWFRIDNLGDFIIQSNLVKKVHESSAKSHTTIVCSKANAKLISEYTFVSKIIVYDKKSSFKEKLRAFKEIYKNEYTNLFCLDGKSFSYLCSMLVKSESKHAVIYKKTKKFLGFFLLNNYKPFFFRSISNLIFTNILILNGKNDLDIDEHFPSQYSSFVNKILNLRTTPLDLYQFPINVNYDNAIKALLNNLNLNEYVIFHIDEKCRDIDEFKYNNNFFFTKLSEKLNSNILISHHNADTDSIKNLYKHFDDLDIHNYKIANDAENKSKKVLIVKNTNLFEFERLINYSKLAISCHSGFMVQVCGANRSEVLDILNEEDGKWIDRWIPLNTNYKRIFKRINNKSLNFDEIIRQIN